MASTSLRFIHASDLHLEQPLAGVEEIPDTLGELLLDAPFRAAERVFDAALREQVDFVLLAGDILRPMAAGPRGLVFLVEQFERLHERKLPVYWSTGRADAATRWTDVLNLPPNVHLFAGHAVKRLLFEREGRLRADILGIGGKGEKPLRVADFRPTHGHFGIALGYGRLESAPVAAHGPHYWALGGRHRRRVAKSAAPVVHYPGTSQGRSPREPGPHGCTLVHVDEAQQIRTRLLATDVVRWHEERVRIDGNAGRGDLQRQLESRAQALIKANPHHALLVRWKIHAPARLAAQLRRGKLAAELLAQLRSEFSSHRPGLWSRSLEADVPAAAPDSWYAEETIRGEFLRAVRDYSQSPAPLEFERYLTERQLAGNLAEAVRIDDAQIRRHVLAEATMLGADLLSGEEPHA
jgi:DNA repair protein SbcD/Mre11